MTAQTMIQQLSLQASLISEATRGMSEAIGGIDRDPWRWRPSPTAWSTVEVIGHLMDEERDDFRARIQRIFAGEQSWPPIDPEGWVRERRHQDRDPDELMENLQDERLRSLKWLEGLAGVNWNDAIEHEDLGPLHAGDLLAAWVAHDLLHVSQILRIRVAWIQHCAAPWSTRYAAP